MYDGTPPHVAPVGGGAVFRYTGQVWDVETGLHYYRARYYAAAAGRFTAPDPLGYADGLNLYAYVGGDPINFADPSGLAREAAINLGSQAWGLTTNFSAGFAGRQQSILDSAAGIDPGYDSGSGAYAFGQGLRNTAIDSASVFLVAGDILNGPTPDLSLGAVGLQSAKAGVTRSTRIHKNSLDYVGDTHVYSIRGPNGTHKIGESARGVRIRDGASIRGEQQVRKLIRETGGTYSSRIRKTFPDKRSARDYETRLIGRYRRMFGDDTLPGNKTNR